MNSDKEKIKIKDCGMTSKENIKKVLDIGVDMIGLIFVPTSKRFLKDKKAIIDFVSQIVQVKKVGVFVNPSAALVSKQIDQYKLDYIQLHGQESADFCSLFTNKVKVIKAFGVDEFFDFKILEKYKTSCDYILFDTYSLQQGGSGKLFDWELLDNKNIPLPFILSGGIDADLDQRISQLSLPLLWGIDINSRFETKPGMKNIDKIKSFVHAIHS